MPVDCIRLNTKVASPTRIILKTSLNREWIRSWSWASSWWAWPAPWSASPGRWSCTTGRWGKGWSRYLFPGLWLVSCHQFSSLIGWNWSSIIPLFRYTYPHKKNISLTGTLFQFLWHFCSITARVLALSLFASALPKWIGPLCAAHWIIMASWIIFQVRLH